MFPDIRAHPPSSDHHLSLNDLMHLRGQNNPILKKQRIWPKIGTPEKVWLHVLVTLNSVFCLIPLSVSFNVMIQSLTFDLLMTFFKYL